MSRIRRHSNLTAFTERLTPSEVATLWFRRARDFGLKIHDNFPDFPRPAPDGLYLKRDVAQWFDRYHGNTHTRGTTIQEAEAKALRIARYGR